MKQIAIPISNRRKSVHEGSFSRIVKDENGTPTVAGWVYCREYFHDDNHGLRWFLYACKKGRVGNIAAFIDKIESKLRLDNRSKFHPSQRPNIMWVRASQWWVDRSMRRSLFTALLRAGAAYDLESDNLEEAMNSELYIRNTMYAVKRFLRGYTKYTGKRRGWYKEFYLGGGWARDVNRPTEREIRKLLIKPN